MRRGVSKGVVHLNTASRKISRLSRRVQGAGAGRRRRLSRGCPLRAA